MKVLNLIFNSRVTELKLLEQIVNSILFLLFTKVEIKVKRRQFL